MPRFVSRFLVFATCLIASAQAHAADNVNKALDAAFATAGENASELRRFLDASPEAQKKAARFLIVNMPERDLRSLKADFLLENTRYAFEALASAPWKDAVPEDIFLNNVLPYASINEGRETWRKDFLQRFKPLIKDAETPAQAAAILNQKIFPLLKVKYSRKRNRADQAPYESIKTGLASCTGLSVLLIDACRAVGLPARFVGTPLWSDLSGNHSWIEVWDDGWHFTGAAEPTGDKLDQAWFCDRSSKAKRDHRLHAIYAVSYKKTPIHFPLVWDRSIDYVHAVNVTDRYANQLPSPGPGETQLRFSVVAKPRGRRVSAQLKVLDAEGKVVFAGETKDERFDGNDHLTATLPVDGEFTVEVRTPKENVSHPLRVGKKTDAARLLTIPLNKKLGSP